jgi:sodium-dependent dicarboxylate transporter 2/3/5
MLPVATPPNAIAYSSGYVRMPDMLRAGLGLNVMGIGVIVCWMWWAAA